MNARVLNHVGFVFALLLPSIATAQTQSAATPRARALLIGAERYANLPMSKSLLGPHNDVQLMRAVLVDLGVPAEQITQLSDDKTLQPLNAWDESRTATAVFAPTRANIQAAFEYEAREAAEKKFDQILILLAGHGAQIPLPIGADPNDPRNPEPDNYDEAFLPTDVAKWDEKRKVVDGAILDNELHDWLAAIAKTGVAVTVIFDTCHAGSMSRGSGPAYHAARSASPEDLGIPDDALPQRAIGPGSKQTLADDLPNVVCLSAAREEEAAKEKAFRVTTADGSGMEERVYGLLTYALARVLRDSNSAITYSEWLDRAAPLVQSRLSIDDGPQRPCSSGPTARKVLGLGAWPLSPLPRVELRDGERFTIRRRADDSVTSGSIYALLRKPGNRTVPEPDTPPYGFARVARLLPSDAEIVPIEYHGLPTTFDLRDSFAREVEHKFDTSTLRVAVLSEEPAWRAVLAKFATEHSAETVDVLVDADLVLQLDSFGRLAAFFKPRGDNLDSPEARPLGALDLSRRETAALSDEEQGRLSDLVGALQRWKKIRDIATSSTAADSPPISLRFHVEGVDQVEPAVSVGQKIGLRLKNVTGIHFDTTVMMLADDFGVSILNGPTSQNPPESFVKEFPVFGRSAAPEHLVLFAFPHDPQTDIPRRFDDYGQHPLSWLGKIAPNPRGGRVQDLEGVVRAYPMTVLAGVPNRCTLATPAQLPSAACEVLHWEPAVASVDSWSPATTSPPPGLATTESSVILLRNGATTVTGVIVENKLATRVVTTSRLLRDGALVDDSSGQAVVDALFFTRGQPMPQTVPAELLDVDAELALFQVRGPSASKASAVPLAKASAKPGDPCVLLGHPCSSSLWSARNVEWPGQDGGECPLGPWDAGAPVVNAMGELLGIAVPEWNGFGGVRKLRIRDVSAVRTLISRAPVTPDPIPDPWLVAPQLGIVSPQVLVSGKDGVPLTAWFDLDGNTPIDPNRNVDELREIVDRHAFDAEVVIRYGPGLPVAFYDRDNDGKFDLILMDRDLLGGGSLNPKADVRFELAHGRWKATDSPNSRPLVDSNFVGATLREEFERLVRLLQ